MGSRSTRPRRRKLRTCYGLAFSRSRLHCEPHEARHLPRQRGDHAGAAGSAGGHASLPREGSLRQSVVRASVWAGGAEPNQVVFTSGGTEADNLAIIGAALAARDRGGPFRVAVSATEHKAVLAA